MRVRGFLVLAALLTTLISANANPPAILADPVWAEEMRNPEVVSDTTRNVRENATGVRSSGPASEVVARLALQDKVFASAYLDTLSILETGNECSDFFGGAAAAADVFARLIGKVRKYAFPPTIGMSMSGETIDVTNERTKSKYRLFGRVSINSNGAFYRDRAPHSLAPLPGVGTFQPNTKEVRVLMFLHELGHAIKGDDDNWLLPDDGKNDDLSRKNSQKIEDVCGKQIKALRSPNVEQKPQLATALEAKNN
ncbi:MAG TPA: hypothetical protein VMZ30_12985 [Pyrinomonadaceae bacterium]|nr:hypothetical protein [Pyrinomonadaceae bacterium]